MQTKRIPILIVFLLMISLSCSGLTLGGSGKAMFATPEDAITYYFEGLAQADFDKLSRALATDEMSEQFDFKEYTDMLGGYFLPMVSLSPTDYPFYVETNKMQLSAQNFNRVKIFAYSLLSSEEVEKGATIQGMDDERVDTFMKDLDPARLAGLELLEIASPREDLMDKAAYRKHASRFAQVYGADESTERVALFSFEGDYYYLGFTLLCYDDNWKISYAISNLAGTNAMGAPEATSRKDFQDLIDN